MRDKKSISELNEILLFIEDNDFDEFDYLMDVSPELVVSLIEEVKAWRINSGPG